MTLRRSILAAACLVALAAVLAAAMTPGVVAQQPAFQIATVSEPVTIGGVTSVGVWRMNPSGGVSYCQVLPANAERQKPSCTAWSN